MAEREIPPEIKELFNNFSDVCKMLGGSVDGWDVTYSSAVICWKGGDKKIGFMWDKIPNELRLFTDIILKKKRKLPI